MTLTTLNVHDTQWDWCLWHWWQRHPCNSTWHLTCSYAPWCYIVNACMTVRNSIPTFACVLGGSGGGSSGNVALVTSSVPFPSRLSSTTEYCMDKNHHGQLVVFQASRVHTSAVTLQLGVLGVWSMQCRLRFVCPCEWMCAASKYAVHVWVQVWVGDWGIHSWCSILTMSSSDSTWCTELCYWMKNTVMHSYRDLRIDYMCLTLLTNCKSLWLDYHYLMWDDAGTVQTLTTVFGVMLINGTVLQWFALSNCLMWIYG